MRLLRRFLLAKAFLFSLSKKYDYLKPQNCNSILRFFLWLVSLEDESIILKLKELKNKLSDASDAYTVSETEQLFIEAGLKDIENGNTFTHQQLMEEVSKKYGL